MSYFKRANEGPANKGMRANESGSKIPVSGMNKQISNTL